MTIVNLAEIRDRQASRHVPISWAEQLGADGQVYREPFYDYSDDGEPLINAIDRR